MIAVRCFTLLLGLALFLTACAQRKTDTSSMQNNTDSTYAYTNHLIHESSPYLLQHAHNPVDWYPWGEEALSKAKRENKLLLISIGYSSCHWCHVMEHESFEDTPTARIMNDHFVCIKVDREERPDIDQIYMNAVQLMTGSGGWPLNCFALPDGRPVYGGTYFPNARWKQVLTSLSNLYQNEPGKAIEYADLLVKGIHQSDLVEQNTGKEEFELHTLKECINDWKDLFDTKEGGPNRAPKFPLPNNYLFLLHYAIAAGDYDVLKQVNLTLEKIAYGGIYDQIGGGFARYSTDSLWKVPHFEKMLYDNAQLVSLYCEAFQQSKNPLYKEVVEETLEWVRREMTSSEGCFYSALDADAEGEEGKYYVWKMDELKNILGNDFPLLADYYNLNRTGYWEDDNYILLRTKSDEEIAKQHQLTPEALQQKVTEWKKLLLSIREKRIKPGLDDKSLTSWNAMMLRAYADTYITFGNPEFLNAALRNAQFILQKQLRSDGGLNHSYKNGRSTINGFLEDYAFTIDAFIALYQVTFDEHWLVHAKDLTDYVIQHFQNKETSTGMFYFTSDLDSSLIARKTETMDNVIPASNSVMANNLFLLGTYFDNENYLSHSRQMLHNIQPMIPKYGSGYSNWALLLLNQVTPQYEIAIVGNEAMNKRKAFAQHFIPNKIFIGSTMESSLPLLENKYVQGKTMIYVCQHKTCRLPVTEVTDAIQQIK